MAVSFLQRFVEDAFNIGLHGAGNFTKGATRSIRKGKGWRNRGEDIAHSWNFTEGSGREAYDQMVEHWARSKGVKGKAWFALNSPFHAAHVVAGAGADVAKGVVGTAATVAGSAVGAIGGTTALVGAKAMKYGVLKPGWFLTKKVGSGVAKGSTALGYSMARDTAVYGAAAGKLLWKTRKDPLMGSLLVGGAIVVGGAAGEQNYQEEALYGSPDGGRYGTRKGFGYMNTEITGGAWQLNRTGPSSKQVAMLQDRINQQGGYQGIMTTKGPGGDQLGATGDLVFALNQLRQGGLF